MRRVILFFLLLAPVAPLVACAADVNEGTVVSKEYDDPDRWYATVDDYAYVPRPYTRTIYNYSSSCKCTTPSTESGIEMQRVWVGSHKEPRYDGPHWTVKVQSDPDSKGKTREQWKTVTEQEYSHYEIGSRYGRTETGGGDF